MKIDLDKIKGLDIIQLYESETSYSANRPRGNEVSGYRSLDNICPFCGSGTHANKSGALCLNRNINTNDSFYCFSCAKKGNVITFVQLVKSLSFRETIEYLNNAYFHGLAIEDDKDKKITATYKQATKQQQTNNSASSSKKKPVDSEVNKTIYELTATLPDCQDCNNYLDARGITADIRRLHYITTYKTADYNKLTAELLKRFGADRLRAAGIMSESSNYFFFKFHRILIFNRSLDGKFLNIKARALPSDVEKYHLSRKYHGTTTEVFPFNVQSIQNARPGMEVILVEGELDAIAANELADGTAAAVATLGSGVGREAYLSLLKLISDKQLIIQPNFDRDDGGENAFKRFAQMKEIFEKQYNIKLQLRDSKKKQRKATKTKDFADILAKVNKTNADDVAKLDICFANPGIYSIEEVATANNWSKLRTRRAFMDYIDNFHFDATFTDDYKLIKIYEY